MWVISRDKTTGFVSVTQPIPDGFLGDQSQVGRDEYRGQVPWADLEF